MKSIFLFVIGLLFVSLANAQSSDVESMLGMYIEVKNALVNSDPKKVTEKATQLLASINQTNIEKLQSAEKKAFSASKADLIKVAQKISNTSDLEKQRLTFGEFSEVFWSFIKQAESVSKQVYYDYCPMKKAYWLSTEESIKNPYYGSKMLTCGKISETKK